LILGNRYFFGKSEKNRTFSEKQRCFLAMKTEISRVFRKNALVFWRNPIFRENRFFAKFRDKQDNIDLNIVFAAPLSGGSFRPAGPAMRPAPETVRRTRPAVSAAAGRLPYAARDGAGLSGRLRGAVLKN